MKKQVKAKPKKTLKPNSGNKKIIYWSVGLILAIAASVFYWQYHTNKKTSDIPAQTSQLDMNMTDHLKGRWQRTDGGYIIEIGAAYSDGKLDAAYFNPNPIHVGRAGWNLNGKNLEVSIELRDVNYPGSTYTLIYQKDQDRLIGVYYQAVNAVNYDVEFIRE